jgi:hypothetical protein
MYLNSVQEVGDRVVWRAYTLVFDQIPNLQNCCTTPNKNLGGEGASDRSTPAAESLYRSIFKKSRHLGFGVFKTIWAIRSTYPKYEIPAAGFLNE